MASPLPGCLPCRPGQGASLLSSGSEVVWLLVMCLLGFPFGAHFSEEGPCVPLAFPQRSLQITPTRWGATGNIVWE